eukprot:CAMPEP_0177759776 /NCGR_PEP_ID=MMETSP0491_2-20121128/4909_1 /TAXON_ID=63592 /ORGANISM="Tetraselmis chuii, Strain PLY429" /LENGTH=241 /DNA_ID=CAMNT_0019275621 /DNA_START=132 /DNA_END=857 /DNA_ORIENTATION=+
MAADHYAERLDGRGGSTLRQFHLERACLNRADGSASWRQEGTEVLAAVYGPAEAPSRRENPECMVVEVLFRPRAGMVSRTDREYEHVVRRTLETALLRTVHPRTVVQVVLQVVSDDGSLLSAALNAACFALVDAGLPMSRLFSSVTCAVLPGPLVLVDPTREEEKEATAVVCLALDNCPRGAVSIEGDKDAKVITSYTAGTFSQEAYLGVVLFSREGQRVIDEFARDTLQKYYSRETLTGA